MSKELAVITQVKTETDKIAAEVVKTAAIKAKTDLISAGHNAIVTSIVGGISSDRSLIQYLNPAGLTSTTPLYSIASGALTANTYKSILSISGSGVLVSLGVLVGDLTARTMSCKIVLDGTTIYEGSQATGEASAGLIPLHHSYGHKLVFNTSLLVQVKSTLTETDKVTTYPVYYLTQDQT